jgi:toxin-antitoxin system PIN domain toxin
MTHLLDVNVLLAAIWENHPHHHRAFRWLAGKRISVCPLSELGFLRVSTNPKAIHAPMKKARALLQTFLTERDARWIPDDLPALDSHPRKTEHVTDFYLAALADKHGMKLATLDEKIDHPAVVLVDPWETPPGRTAS